MSDTPDTDKEEYDSGPGNPMCPNGIYVVSAAFARKLERERNQLRETVTRYQRAYKDGPDEEEEQ